MCQYLLACLRRGRLYAGKYTSIEIAMDKRSGIYGATGQISPGSGKALWVKYDKRQVTLCKWKKWLSGSSEGE